MTLVMRTKSCYDTGDDVCYPCYAGYDDGDGDDNDDDDDDGDGDDDVCYPCYAGACTLPAESQAWKRKIFKHREFTTYQNDVVEIG